MRSTVGSLIAGIGALCCALVASAQPATPTSAELTTTSVTLQRLAHSALIAKDASAVSAFAHAYQHVRRQVPAASAASLADADKYMQELATRNLLLIESTTHSGCTPSSPWFPVKRGKGGFTHMPSGIDLDGLLETPRSGR